MFYCVNCFSNVNRRFWGRCYLLAASIIVITPWYSSIAFAHAFGERYDLPLPISLYLSAAVSVVIFSFGLSAYFIRVSAIDYSRHFTLLYWPGNLAFQKFGLLLIRCIGVALFLLVLACGIWGQQDAFHNIAPTFVWVIGWIGLVFIFALIGDFWPLINPWLSLAIFARWGCIRYLPKNIQRQGSTWFENRGEASAWCCVISLGVFFWLELIWPYSEKPINTAIILLIYSVYLWGGMLFFGIGNWLERGDLFTNIFGVFGRFSPLAVQSKTLRLRLPGSGLVTHQPASFARSMFVIVLLAMVSFDGILETVWWQGVLQSIAQSQFLRPTLLSGQRYGVDLLMLIKTIAFVGFPLLLMAIFMLFCKFSSVVSGTKMPVMESVGHYVYALVPIALAYHITHYASYLLIAGQQMIPLGSDPFGFGWNLLNTQHYRLDLSIVNAKMIWILAIFSVVVGHVIAVILAHVRALEIHQNRSVALLSQLPMLMLMIAYTLLSLWILSQPLTT
ncbi:MAG: hypothetical protein COB51_11190 [Moraxellaceae bacterium]|nr:MAG: hypothetical protein COB51_11190 [Moraxellaceae bacterium]